MPTPLSPETTAVLQACGATSMSSALNLAIAGIAGKAIRAGVDIAGDWECADRLLFIADELDSLQ
jgi:hypothetical protein